MIVDHDLADLEGLLALVRDFAGLDFPAGRRGGLSRPIDAACERLDLGTVGALRDHLADPANRVELERFVSSVTVGETHFFRIHPQVEAIRRLVLPDLLARHGGNRRLRILSAGCSTGEEPYSLAIIVDEMLPKRDGWDITILGTDIDREALDRAREASYGEWSFRGVPDEIRRRCFRREANRFRLHDHIRDMVRFEYLNLADDAEMERPLMREGFDLILCRNVLIYFPASIAMQVVARLERKLMPCGWLLTGHAEAPMVVFRELLDAYEQPETVVFRKRASGAPLRSDFVPPDAVAPALPERPQPAATPDTSDRAATIARLQVEAEDNPLDPSPLLLAARLLAAATQYEAAEQTVRSALDRDELDSGAHYVHGLVLDGLGRSRDALDALRRAVYLDPGNALAHFSMAVALDRLGQRARAADVLAHLGRLLAVRESAEVIDALELLTVGRLRELVELRQRVVHEMVSR